MALFDPDPSEEEERPELSYRSFTDVPAQRQAVFDRVRDAYAKKRMEYGGHTLEFADVDYKDARDFTLRDEKAAVLGRKRLYRPLRGRLRLLDAEGNVIREDEKARTLAQVPYLSRRGTFIHNGTEYAVANQQRLRAGIYTRRQANGDVESQFNIIPGTGRGFRVRMDPASGVFRIQAGQSNMKLFPVLKDMGFTDKQLKETWGKEIYEANALADDKDERVTLSKLAAKLGGKHDAELSPEEAKTRLSEIFNRMRLDPVTTRRTMGKAYDHVDGQTLLDSTNRILRVNRDEEDGDDRDDLPFQSFHAPEDFFAEHVEKDAQQLIRQAYWRMKNGKNVPDNFFTKQLQSVLLGSGVAAPLQEINPIELLDARHKIIRLGEGGIGSTQAVSREARGVQPSHFGFIDPIRAPESDKIGLDMRLAQGVVRGSDGLLYAQVRNAKTGQNEYLSTENFLDKPVAFPGEIARAKARLEHPERLPAGASERQAWGKVRAMDGGRLRYVPLDQVHYELPEAGNMFTPGSNFVPLASALKGQRLLMGARMQSQALPLEEPEAPLVQSEAPGGTSMSKLFSRDVGAVFSDQEGVIKKVTPDEIVVQYADGTTKSHDLYNMHPLNQKTSLHNTPVVKPGDVVGPEQLLARSNFTDGQGNVALGRNLRTAFHMMDGMTHEDAIVLSDSAAQKFRSEQMYSTTLERNDEVDHADKDQYAAKYPGVFTSEQLKNIDKNGVVKPGTVVNQGDPLVLAVGRKKTKVKGSLLKGPKSQFTDASETWEHEQPGEVVDVFKTGKGWRVTARTYTPTTVGDKIANSYGGKGVVARVVPDDQMPTDAEGNPIEIALNPMGVISRVNPSQIIESALGKVAAKTGKPYVLPGFSDKHLSEFAMQELEKHGLSDLETLIDPRTGREMPNIFTGVQHFYKLHHLAESKLNARNQAAYTMDDQPAKGGKDGSKRLGLMESFSLLSHGATEVMRDAKLIRGQRNDDFWRLYRLGMNPPEPRISRQYQKFEAMLQGSGINLKKKGTQTQVLPMTDADVQALTGDRDITSSATVDFDSGEPIEGGLFDIAKTGGADGTKWSYIKLPEKLPNPIMEEPVKSLLGLTGKQFERVLSGEDDLHGLTGGKAIEQALRGLNIEEEMRTTKEIIRSGKRTARDKAVKRLGYLTSLHNNQIKPQELMMERVPVVPPRFRPVSRMEGVDLVSDVNYLYKEMMEAKENYEQAAHHFGTPGDTRLDLYNTFKAATGMGKPVSQENQQRNVRGLLKQVLGDSPKYGFYQRSVIGQPVDLVGRGVIVPEPDYDIDEVGLPAEAGWEIFKPFIIRDLTRRGKSAVNAIKSYTDRSPDAQEAMKRVIEERPLIINRAPSLHKHNLTAHQVRLVPGNAIRLPVPILAGHGADFDGDALNFHVPVSDKAVREAKDKMMPSRMLYSAKDFQVHMLPTQGYAMGLYHGSTGDSGRPRRTFRTSQDVIEAYRSGEIGPTDPITVLQD